MLEIWKEMNARRLSESRTRTQKDLQKRDPLQVTVGRPASAEFREIGAGPGGQKEGQELELHSPVAASGL